MQFSIYQESRRGTRRSNQDRIGYCYTKEALLMLVADGMGGHLHGEIAAQLALEFISVAFRSEAKPALSDPASFLRRTLTGAHHAILQHTAEGGLPETPRTTCVACVVQDGAACWAHAGDSRLYHIRDGAILAQTKDHSLVQQLIDRGRIREEAFAAHPERNQIFSCLGSARPPRVDVSAAVRLHAGDSLLLCSDGLWSPLTSKKISSAVHNSGIMQAVPELLDESERRAGRECDNLSVIALTWEQHSEVAPPEPVARGQAAADARNSYLSDEEIERAIDNIRNAMKGHPNGKT